MPHFRAAFLLCIFFVNTFWSEWGDSNSRHLAPKASALPTALHPVMKFFQLWSNMWSRSFFDQLQARGKVLSGLLSQGFPGFPRVETRTRASRSQSRRATNCATPKQIKAEVISVHAPSSSRHDIDSTNPRKHSGTTASQKVTSLLYSFFSICQMFKY